MSLVGPRPVNEKLFNQFEAEIEGFADRTCVPPGMTGLTQILMKPDHSVGDVDRRFQLDMRHISSRNIFLDTIIVLSTIALIVRLYSRRQLCNLAFFSRMLKDISPRGDKSRLDKSLISLGGEQPREVASERTPVYVES